MFRVGKFLEPETYLFVLCVFLFASTNASQCAMSRYCEDTVGIVKLVPGKDLVFGNDELSLLAARFMAGVG